MISGGTEVNLFSQNHLTLFFPMLSFDHPEKGTLGRKVLILEVTFAPDP